MTRVFLDTNVVLSALLGHGLCNDLFDLVIERYTLVLSDEVLAECDRLLKAKFRVPAPQRREFLAALRAEAEIVPPATASTPTVAPDPDDTPILAAALAARVPYFVTGDKALLALRTIESMRIVSPRRMWDVLAKSK